MNLVGLLKRNWAVLSIIFVGAIMFSGPLFSNQPLGLDGIGHYSKVSYINEFGFVNWDMSWYSGTLFLKLYPPLFYYLDSLFPSEFMFFGGNLICFLSLLFTAIGIFYLVDCLVKNKRVSLVAGLSFFTVLSISYYWVATANLPYFAALWTIPFSLYFLEKSLNEKKHKYFIGFVLVFTISILTHVITGFLIGLFMIIRILFEGFNWKNFKKMFFYGGIPVLLSSFWFIPFLIFSKSGGEYSGYVPKILQLFGLVDFVSWGNYAGGIGLLLFVFLGLFVFYFIHYKKIGKDLKYFLSLIFILAFLLMGGLFNHYPYGVDPVRFILPFSILLIISSALFFDGVKLTKSKFWVFLILVILVAGLIWNFNIVENNLGRYNYVGSDSRYGMFQDFENLPFSESFDNYRFGTSRYVFGETINYFVPSASQTFGYQDAGMLNAPKYYDMRWHIWMSEDVNDSIYWLDWFGIKYFEADNGEVGNKFLNDSRFSVYSDYSENYEFKIYEYLDARPIISFVNNLENGTLGERKDFNYLRESPDKIFVNYSDSDFDDWIIFKEFYHENWVAKRIDSGEYLAVQKVGPGFMGVNVSEGSGQVILKYQKSLMEYFSIVLSVLGIFVLIYYKKLLNFLKIN